MPSNSKYDQQFGKELRDLGIAKALQTDSELAWKELSGALQRYVGQAWQRKLASDARDDVHLGAVACLVEKIRAAKGPITIEWIHKEAVRAANRCAGRIKRRRPHLSFEDHHSPTKDVDEDHPLADREFEEEVEAYRRIEEDVFERGLHHLRDCEECGSLRYAAVWHKLVLGDEAAFQVLSSSWLKKHEQRQVGLKRKKAKKVKRPKGLVKLIRNAIESAATEPNEHADEAMRRAMEHAAKTAGEEAANAHDKPRYRVREEFLVSRKKGCTLYKDSLRALLVRRKTIKPNSEEGPIRRRSRRSKLGARSGNP